MRLVLLLACAAAFAQTARPPAKKAAPKAAASAPEPVRDKWPIQLIKVEGAKVFTRDQIVAATGLKVGQLAGKPEFESAREKLVNSGAFETVGYKFEPSGDKQGFVATFQVVEAQPTFPLQFEDLGVAGAEIERALAAQDPLFSSANLPATKNVLDRYTFLVQEFLATKGITEPITAKVVPVTTERYAILIRPVRGLPAVAEVSFSGNQVVPDLVLRDAIHYVGIGSPYTEAGFREILNHAIRSIYEQRGRVRVSFPEIRAEPVKDVQGVHVFVKIDEGASYELGKVAIAGPSPLEPAALLKTGDFKTGDVANFDRVNEGLERIRLSLRRAGYLQAKTRAERKIDDAKKTVAVDVYLEPGAQYTMGKFSIVGLDLNGEAEINRIWTMKEGKVFNPEYPDHFLQSIKEQGLFDNLGQTKAEVKVNDSAHTADVTLRFSGAPPAGRGGRGF